MNELVAEFQTALDMAGPASGAMDRRELISAASQIVLEAIELVQEDQRKVVAMAKRLRMLADYPKNR